MRIRTTTGHGASPLHGGNENADRQQRSSRSRIVGEGIGEPLLIRAGRVRDVMIKFLERVVTSIVEHDTVVLPLPTKPTEPTEPSGSTSGRAA